MTRFYTSLFLAILLFAVSVSAVPVIDEFHPDPTDPYADESFNLHVLASSADGIDYIRFYYPNSNPTNHLCNGATGCQAIVAVTEDDPGYYEYSITVYSENGTHASADLTVHVLDSDNTHDLEITSFYANPSNPREDNTFDLRVRAEDSDGIDKIKFYADGDLEDTIDCDHDDVCTETIEWYETTSGYHEYKVKAYSDDGETETEELLVYVRPYDSCGNGVCSGYETCSSCPADCGQCRPLNYCGNGICNSGETCSSCPSDCGQCQPVNFCGNGICNSGESCSSCPSDCGYCPVLNFCGDGKCTSGESCSSCRQDCGSCQQLLPTIVYTCEQRGGECCKHGGKDVINGAADCPAKCFSSCNAAPEQEKPTTPTQPTGAVIAIDSGLVFWGLLAVIVVLLLALLATRK